MNLVILGRIPSKKNSRINTRSGRSFPSTKYTEWHKDASLQVRQHILAGLDPMDVESQVKLRFYMPDNRRCDLTNKAESIMDLLVDCGIIQDDCWQITGPVHLIPGGIDKEDPRCEIEL